MDTLIRGYATYQKPEPPTKVELSVTYEADITAYGGGTTHVTRGPYSLTFDNLVPGVKQTKETPEVFQSIDAPNNIVATVKYGDISVRFPAATPVIIDGTYNYNPHTENITENIAVEVYPVRIGTGSLFSNPMYEKVGVTVS